MFSRVPIATALCGLLAAGFATAQDAEPESQDLIPTTVSGTRYACKCYPGDACWPKPKDWTKLNKTVDGNLATAIPPGAPCHNTFNGLLGSLPTYNAAECADVTASWTREQWQIEHPIALMWTLSTNETCRPTTNPQDTCTSGYYGVYVIEAKTKAHIKEGIDFARKKNLRLIIRNTGHDFIGRSTGWGSLIINTHSFQDYKFHKNWKGPGGYKGSAVTMGAGIQGRDFLRIAHAQNPPQVVVTGECPTVGIAGGFLQGGGHGPWTPLKGFAADNALEFEAITADGKFVKANAKENPDLYWALKGGGPATFAVAISTTVATYTDLPSAGIILDINSTHTSDLELFWSGVRHFTNYSNSFASSGLYAYFGVRNLRLHVQPLTGINKTAAEVTAIVKPLLEQFDAIGLNYTTVTKEFPSFFDLYIDMFEDELAGSPSLTGGWTFTHDNIATNTDGMVAAYRNTLDNGGIVVGHIWESGKGVTESAIHPSFRNAATKIIAAVPVAVNASLAEKQVAQDKLANVIDPVLRAAGPGGCAYINEADPLQANWQTNFWGSNYPKLKDLRKKWDPKGVFYAVSTPGTEEWEVIEYGTRLCKRL
ncbi:hypothetical protein QBC34DRAFT_437309 [Podospora aff. communis PSN243]|uniref:FAD-binding PCMH-type domain-containing protein n=1 Tax=Podospora aff. communis PSN243 TaxID=3040156 RepID=A0AAV9GSG1_9PEZI|nr:hypothetical protein QBC34DRAFT_437309 [Podospora aff. communis PSN243]